MSREYWDRRLADGHDASMSDPQTQRDLLIGSVAMLGLVVALVIVVLAIVFLF